SPLPDRKIKKDNLRRERPLASIPSTISSIPASPRSIIITTPPLEDHELSQPSSSSQVYEINMISVATQGQKNNGKAKENTPAASLSPSTIPITPPPKVVIRGPAYPVSNGVAHRTMIKQLHQSPVKMTLYDLIQTSESHRQALVEILQGIEVLPNETLPVASILTPNHVASLTKQSISPTTSVSKQQAAAVSFSDDEIIDFGAEDPDPALFISAYVRDIRVRRVMIDGGASLNIISSKAFQQMNIPSSCMCANPIMLRSFNDAITSTLGTVILNIRVGP
ncbi:hypothetical protein KI387_041569, partial [Taxus chinensis]